MIWTIMFTLEDSRVVKLPVISILDVKDDIAGSSCIVVTRREHYHVYIPRARVQEAIQFLDSGQPSNRPAQRLRLARWRKGGAPASPPPSRD
jgi:hypothetical protein